jgi:Ca2+-binding EF-hand superfamily protein
MIKTSSLKSKSPEGPKVSLAAQGLKGWLGGSLLNEEERSPRASSKKSIISSAEDLGDVEPQVHVSEQCGEVTLPDDLNCPQAKLWTSFAQWVMSTFQDSEEMMQKLRFSNRLVNEEDRLSFEDFCLNLVEYNWRGGNEALLYKMHCPDSSGLKLKNFQWVDREKRYKLRKDKARQKALSEAEMRIKNQLQTKMVKVKFKALLKQSHGSYIRAWRRILSPDDSMVLRKVQFFAACSELGWASDVRRLWRSFGKASNKDEAGFISIEELAPKSAEVLAHFREWMVSNFGNASNAFRQLDRHNKKSLTKQDFVAAVEDFGFEWPPFKLFHDLNKGDTRMLVMDDMLFLDRWTPPAFLTASPNHDAVEQFKAMVLAKFRSYLKAWRRIMDTDNSNHCDWQEFQIACGKHLQFHKDVPGAWRALDKDLRGYISLAQIDPSSAQRLQQFREWATTEFGSVKSAFRVFDVNGNWSVGHNEFRNACRIYGFHGDASKIFKGLDVERNSALSMEEVNFLDDWDIEDMLLPPEHEQIRKTIVLEARQTMLGLGRKSETPQESVESCTSKKAVTPAPLTARNRKYTALYQPERVTWTDIPCRPMTTPKKVRSSRGNTVWCAVCKTRGCCSHVREHFQRLTLTDPDSLPVPRMGSATPSIWGRSSPSSPMQSARRASTSMSTTMPSWAWDAQRNLYSARGASPLTSRNEIMPRLASPVNCCSPEAEVQYMALRAFPMGSVTHATATQALRVLASGADVISSACESLQTSRVYDATFTS